MTAYPVAILAGGLATRLRPITEKIPKALLEVAGRPFIHHQLKLLKARGLSRVVVCAGYLGGMIRDQVGNGHSFGLEVSYSFDGDRLLGTGGALKKALPLLGPAFFVLYGDSYLTCDYLTVQKTFEASGCQGLMTVYRNEGRYDASNVAFENGRITVYDKTSQTDRLKYIDYGLGMLKARVFEKTPAQEPFDLASLYQGLSAAGDLAGYETPERFYEIGSKEGWAELDGLLKIRRGPEF